jgi:hypothetical protein
MRVMMLMIRIMMLMMRIYPIWFYASWFSMLIVYINMFWQCMQTCLMKLTSASLFLMSMCCLAFTPKLFLFNCFNLFFSLIFIEFRFKLKRFSCQYTTNNIIFFNIAFNFLHSRFKTKILLLFFKQWIYKRLNVFISPFFYYFRVFAIQIN